MVTVSARTDWNKERRVGERLAARQQRWSGLYEKGGCMMSEMIAADYDTTAPNGLDIIPQADHRVNFANVADQPYFKNLSVFGKISESRWFGVVSDHKTIELGPLFNLLKHTPFYNQRKATNLGCHEGNHIYQRTEALKAGFTSIYDGNVYDGHSEWGLSFFNRMRLKIRRGFIELKTRAQNYFAFGTEKYLARHNELQARMGEIIPAGYASWQRLPGTKHELWAALYHMGLKAPAAILHELRTTEEGRRAFSDFRVSPQSRAHVARTVRNLNRVYESGVMRPLREGLWRNIYPVSYGNYIEFIGDGLGRARMGFGSNPRPMLEVLDELRNNPERVNRNTIPVLAAKIPADVSHIFLNNLIKSFPEDHVQIHKAMVLAQALLEREDVMRHLENMETGRNYIRGEGILPLKFAIVTGHAPMVDILTRAGLDPFQRYDVMDMAGVIKYTETPVEASSADVISIRKGLQALAVAHSEPDIIRSVYNQDGNPVITTLREQLRKMNIEMPASSGLTPAIA